MRSDEPGAAGDKYVSFQLSVVSCQLSVVSGQWSVVSGQLIELIRPFTTRPTSDVRASKLSVWLLSR